MLQLYVNLAVFICTTIGFVYGISRFFKRVKAMYLQIIVCALGCMMLGRLFRVVMMVTEGGIPRGFHVGVLGTIGSFRFFFSANFGQMDHLLDDGAKDKRKYRLLALLAPAVIAAGYIPIVLSDSSLEYKIVCAVVVLFIMQASYFNLKHIIMPDVELGIVGSIRNYNILALVYALLSMAEMTLWISGNPAALWFIYTLLCFVSLALVPVLERGVKKWTI